MKHTKPHVTIIAVLIIAASCALAQNTPPKEPEELIRLRQQYNQRREAALKPIDASYQQQLELLIKSLTQRNQLDAALSVRKELGGLTAVESGHADKPTPDELLAKGIVTNIDFRNYLVATGKWTWEIGKHRDQTIKFKPDGTALHTELIMKYSIDSIGVVTVRHPNGHSAKVTFSKDFKSYEGAWDKTVPLAGTRIE